MHTSTGSIRCQGAGKSRVYGASAKKVATPGGATSGIVVRRG